MAEREVLDTGRKTGILAGTRIPVVLTTGSPGEFG
jgi:hypothetical protein